MSRFSKHLSLGVLAAFVLAAPAGRLAAAPSVMFEVSAPAYDSAAVPVFVPLPPPLRAAGELVLTDETSGGDVPVQRVPGRPEAAFVTTEMTAGETRLYRLGLSDRRETGSPPATCRDDGTRLNLNVGDRHVLAYNHAVLPAPEGIDPVFARSGHIHPFLTPSGLPLTDDFPPDHAHQHGIFFAWVNTTFAGRSVDFWNQAKQLGNIEHASVLDMTSGPVFAQFRVLLHHKDLTASGPPVVVLEETWTVRVYNVPGYHLVDLESEQRCAADEPLLVNDFHYGGLALRGARDWFEQEGSDFLTSEGKTRADGNHSRARWVVAHGRSAGQPAAMIVLGHPDNLRAPQHVRLHPAKPYFCFAPMVLGDFEIAPEKPLVSRYRFAGHDGPPNAELAEHLWRQYVDGPVAKLVSR